MYICITWLVFGVTSALQGGTGGAWSAQNPNMRVTRCWKGAAGVTPWLGAEPEKIRNTDITRIRGNIGLRVKPLICISVYRSICTDHQIKSMYIYMTYIWPRQYHPDQALGSGLTLNPPNLK